MHKHYAVYTSHAPQLEVPFKVLLYVLLVFQDFQRCTDVCFSDVLATLLKLAYTSIHSLAKKKKKKYREGK